jgi:SAM-dependent methyltransferase
MKRTLLRIISLLGQIGFNPLTLLSTIKGFPFYCHDLIKFKQYKNSDFIFGPLKPVFSDRFAASGCMSGHYFHQDLFVARKIFINNPKRHVDIGSRIDGFIAHVATFREIEVIDIRQQKSVVINIVFKQADLMILPEDMINSCDSVSALHSIEHFGLGRYGDPLDGNGHLKAIHNIAQMLQENGTFYFSVPIGRQRIEFNAHRVFSIEYLINILSEHFDLTSFSYVNDKGDLIEDAEIASVSIKNNFDCNFGCGIFELKKKQLVTFG